MTTTNSIKKTTNATTQLKTLSEKLIKKAEETFLKVSKVREIDNALLKLNPAYKIVQDLKNKSKNTILNSSELVQLANSENTVKECIKAINKFLNPYNKDLKVKQLKLFNNELEFFKLFQLNKIALVKKKSEKNYNKYTLEIIGIYPTLNELSLVSEKSAKIYNNVLSAFLADVVLWQQSNDEIGLSSTGIATLKTLLKESLKVKNIASSTAKTKHSGNEMVITLCPDCNAFISKKHLVRISKVLIPQTGLTHNLTPATIKQAKKEILMMIHQYLNEQRDNYRVIQHKQKDGKKIRRSHTIY